MRSAAEANVDTAKDAATLRMHQEMNGNAGGMHPVVVVGNEEGNCKRRISLEAGFVEGKVQG